MLQPLRILVKREPSGLLIASSPDLEGLHVMERSEAELQRSLIELIPVLFAEKGEKVAVTQLLKLDKDKPTDEWVVADVRASSLVHAD